MKNKAVYETPVVEERKEIKLVGLRVLCEGNQYIHEIPKASTALRSQLQSIQHVVDSSKQIGAFVVDAQTKQEDGYWVCVEVEKYEDVPADMVELTIPPQKYAVTKHIGRNDEIKNSYEILHNWIQKNGYIRLLKNWHIEIFHTFNVGDQLEIDLYDTIQ
ncbi:GyrI-like domain-containing protein [Fictibacillus norfolkensis]|uniref:Effector binding domain-containing protein n=1 Tax=Fictibacillus norfolkensis TaxID=2762233 RepID=A0ABR8SJF9_9BACL|nr:GyrI-like domain-containing protein [Fictibacillus norfolkensis]MBD7963624.1 effector binding domain-containing protein [Fictibacillus norfolkensis]